MRLIKLTALLVTISVLLTGCWDEQEMTELAPITGLGIDPGDRPGTVKVSVQISPPAPAGAVGGTGGGDVKLRVITIEASTMFEAINLLFAHTRREPFLRHLGYIIFGEEMAKAGIAGVLGGMQGLVTIRGSVPVLVCVGSAEDMFKARSGIGRSPGQDVVDILSNLQGAPLGATIRLNDVINTLSSLGSELALPIVESMPLRLEAGDNVPYDGTNLEGQQMNEIIITRTAVFDRDKWVHDLDPYLTQMFILLRGDTQAGSKSIANPVDPLGAMAVQYEQFRPSFSPRVTEEGNIQLEVKTQVRTRLIEIRGSYDLREDGFDPIIRTLQNEVNQQVLQVFRILQEHGTDALGIGSMIYRKQPRLWSQLEPHWDEIFPTIDVQVQADVRIVGTSLIVRQFRMKGK